MSLGTQRIRLMLDKLSIEVDHGRIDNDWVCDFVHNMKALVKRGRPLSDSQISKLEELFGVY